MMLEGKEDKEKGHRNSERTLLVQTKGYGSLLRGSLEVSLR